MNCVIRVRTLGWQTQKDREMPRNAIMRVMIIPDPCHMRSVLEGWSDEDTVRLRATGGMAGSRGTYEDPL